MNRTQVEEYVERELGGLPAGWRLERPESGRLWWSVRKTSFQRGEWPDQEFSLHVSEDFGWFIVTYDNNDVGPGSPYQKAKVLPASSLKPDALRSFIQFVMKNCKPNEWGYT